MRIKKILFIVITLAYLSSQNLFAQMYGGGDGDGYASLSYERYIKMYSGGNADGSAIGSTAGEVPLPVELISFTAEANQDQVILHWQTATEVDNYGFEVERTSVGQITNLSPTWETVTFIEGHGNSNSPVEYSFTDNPTGGSKFQYRLKQIDTDGSYSYSEIVEVEMVPTKFELFQNYPNPFNPTTKIKFSIPQFSKVVIKVYDILGNEVTTLVNERKEEGRYQITFDASDLSSGVYIYQIRSGDFIDTKKMILMK